MMVGSVLETTDSAGKNTRDVVGIVEPVDRHGEGIARKEHPKSGAGTLPDKRMLELM